jgi:hypothetical protein
MPFDVGRDDGEDDRALENEPPRKRSHLAAVRRRRTAILANIAKFLADDHKMTFDRMP